MPDLGNSRSDHAGNFRKLGLSDPEPAGPAQLQQRPLSFPGLRGDLERVLHPSEYTLYILRLLLYARCRNNNDVNHQPALMVHRNGRNYLPALTCCKQRRYPLGPPGRQIHPPSDQQLAAHHHVTDQSGPATETEGTRAEPRAVPAPGPQPQLNQHPYPDLAKNLFQKLSALLVRLGASC